MSFKQIPSGRSEWEKGEVDGMGKTKRAGTKSTTRHCDFSAGLWINEYIWVQRCGSRAYQQWWMKRRRQQGFGGRARRSSLTRVTEVIHFLGAYLAALYVSASFDQTMLSRWICLRGGGGSVLCARLLALAPPFAAVNCSHMLVMGSHAMQGPRVDHSSPLKVWKIILGFVFFFIFSFFIIFYFSFLRRFLHFCLAFLLLSSYLLFLYLLLVLPSVCFIFLLLHYLTLSHLPLPP